MAQPDTNEADKILLTMAAGNSSKTSPDIPAGLPIYFASLRDVMVAVVATDRSGQLATFNGGRRSNACGKAAKWCLAAPGKSIILAYSDGSLRDYVRGQGTSVAAPMVAGGLAVVMQYFGDSLGHTEVLQRLYTTADKTGPAAPDRPATEYCPDWLNTDDNPRDCELSSTHGQGIMDIGAATRPVGQLLTTTSANLDGPKKAASASRLQQSPASGNAMLTSLQDQSMVVFDELDAPFQTHVSEFTSRPEKSSLRRRLANLLAPSPDLAKGDGV